jgi:hypothetical protein
MTRRVSELRLTNVRVVKDGSPLKDAITAATPADGGRIKVEFYVDFSSEGGDFVIEPGTANEEIGSYDSIDIVTDELVGVTRPDPKAHSAGMFVQAGTDPNEEKLADGFVDGDTSDLVYDVPVIADVWPFLAQGSYDQDIAPTVWMGSRDDDDDDEPSVLTGPVGATPVMGADPTAMAPVGGGDQTETVTTPTGQVQPPAGMGWEDGATPASSPSPVVTSGIGNTLFCRWTTIANSSIVTYEIHCIDTAERTLRGGTSWAPTADSLVHSVSLAGTPDLEHVVALKDFPSGHILDGTASDPPQSTITYFFKVVAKDGTGGAAASAEASGSPIDITSELLAIGAVTETKIADDAISTPKLQANAITAAKIAANTITANEIAANAITTSELAADAVTATKINVSSLSAINANLGTVTAGSITGVTITGGTVQTANSGGRLVMSATNATRLDAFDSGGTYRGGLVVDTSGVHLVNASLVSQMAVDANGPKMISGSLQWANAAHVANPSLQAGGGTAIPGNPSKWLRIRDNAGADRWIPCWAAA